MALTGELSDLSLAELIEFFCNQRKTGRLKVIYPIGPGYFYLQAGSVVHARIGELRGIEAVYCALTLSNASFTFSPAFEAPEHTINQPWTSVVLEGLRRMDEGILAPNPFPEDKHTPEPIVTTEAAPPEVATAEVATAIEESIPEAESKDAPIELPITASPEIPAFVSEAGKESRWRSNPWTLAAVVFAVLLVVAVIGVPWAMYARNKAARLSAASSASQPATAETSTSSVPTNETSTAPTPDRTVVPAANTPEAEQFAKKLREAHAKERARAQESAATTSTSTAQPEANTTSTANSSSPKTQSSPAAAGRKVTVQVTYDENGRVTQASGGDATALRIARQKRFPAGKGGSATVTIPIN